MSDGIIKTGNASYTKYEELLARRDDVRKQAFQYERAYVREFGDLILQVFEMKLECIRKKKTIGYCQTFINRGESVDQDALQEYLQKELAEYQAQLDDMIRDNEAAKEHERVSEADLLKIKRIYRKIAKKIHPDINPGTARNEELMELWQRLAAAYNCNDLKEMEETEVLINAVLAKMDLGAEDISIPDIGEKIEEIRAEIERIKNTDPYRYKFLLEDPEAVEQKKQELRDELKEYEDYGRQLDGILDGMLANGGVKLTWRMN
ncbi:MAG: hypothetical protein K6F53_07090 [Lachnospiraceae bacterium]|nr:hypothetical protein [Lachnospiraceae bacterium]